MKKGTAIICIIVSVVVIIAALVSVYFIFVAHRSPVETSEVITAEVRAGETEAPSAEAPTEGPTEPDHTDAYRAYRDELQSNRSAITDYDWQASGGDTMPVVFCDIMGDETPEMIYVYAVKVEGSRDGHHQGQAGLRVFTYQDGSIKKAYENTGWSQNYAQVSDEPYLLFQTQGDNTLYAYRDNSKTYSSFEILRLADSGNGSLSEEKAVELFYGYEEYVPSESRVEGEDVSVSAAEQKARELIESKSSALMVAANGQDRYEDHVLSDLGIDPSAKENEALTYADAIAYLNGLIGDETAVDTAADDQAQESDLSAAAGEYSYLKWSGYGESDISISADGSISRHEYNYTGASRYDSVSNGMIADFQQDGSLSTKYTFHVAGQALEKVVGTVGVYESAQGNLSFDNTDYALFDTDAQVTIYLKGTAVSDLSDDVYEEFQKFENGAAANGVLNGNLLVIPDEYHSKLYM